MVTLAEAQSIAQKPHKVSLYQVGLRPNSDIDAVLQRIEAVSKDLAASKASEFDGSEAWTGIMNGYAWGIAAIAIYTVIVEVSDLDAALRWGMTAFVNIQAR